MASWQIGSLAGWVVICLDLGCLAVDCLNGSLLGGSSWFGS